MKHITIVAGARPNFIKISPIINEIKNSCKIGNNLNFNLVHTGQHYDSNMSGSFFNQLGIPQPKINLSVGSGSQAEQTAKIMIGFEKFLISNPTEMVLVVGDVTSTMACSITARKLNIKVAHVEAGIRSGDWSMPEEINRVVTDSISNYFFTTSKLAGNNLKSSGINEKNIFFVGNTMIDTLLNNISNFIKPSIWSEKKLEKDKFLIITLHRPSNVDQANNIKRVIDEILENSKDFPIVFPVHPRTAKILNQLNIKHPRLHLISPLSYLEFNYLVKNSFAVITDSGGITEETTVMKIPCLTLRDNTERPETITTGTNVLVGTNHKNIAPHMKKLFSGSWKKGDIPELWDGNSAKRIVDILINL